MLAEPPQYPVGLERKRERQSWHERKIFPSTLLAGPFQRDSISNRKTIASATPRLEVDPRELKITAATVWRDLPPVRSGVPYVRPVPNCGYVLIGSRACHHIRQSISDSGTGDTPAG